MKGQWQKIGIGLLVVLFIEGLSPFLPGDMRGLVSAQEWAQQRVASIAIQVSREVASQLGCRQPRPEWFRSAATLSASALTPGYLMVFQLARNGGATVEQADSLASQGTAADVKKALGQLLQQTQQNGRPFCDAFQ